MTDKIASVFLVERGMVSDDFTYVDGAFASRDLALAHIKVCKDRVRQDWISWKDTEDAKAQAKHGVYGYEGTFETWWRNTDETYHIEELKVAYSVEGSV